MRFPGLLLFLLLAPALIALGHDIHLFYANHAAEAAMVTSKLVEEKFKFSAFGFIWTTYSPETYKTTAASTDPETWAMIDSFLTIKAFYAGLTFAGAIIALMVFFALFGLGPMAGDGGRIYGGKDKAPTIHKKGEKMKYNRK